jgi:uncharacterized membrane protein (DUF2068 family)
METPELRPPRGKPSAALIGIIVFKYVECAAFLFVGGAVLRVAGLSAHPGPLRIAREVGVEESHVTIRSVASLLSAFTPGEVQALGLAAVLIGLVFGVEGTCLALRIWWAPYLTIALTAAAIPPEFYEIARRPESVRRWVLLAINVATLVYLWGRRNDFRRTAPR